MAMNELWAYRDPGWRESELEGFKVEGLDGTIGHVRESINATGRSFLLVDTGPWIFGKRVLLPAGLVDRVHPEEKIVYIERTKDAVKEGPVFDEDRGADEAYLDEVGSYYAILGGARSVAV
jgi:hypothetical protein